MSPEVDDYLVRLGSQIRNYRELQKLSQDELSYITGLAKNYIGKVERAEANASIQTLRKLAKGLKIRLFELILDEG